MKLESFKNLNRLVKGPYWTLYEATRADTESRHFVQVLDEPWNSDHEAIAAFETLWHYNKMLHHSAILQPQSYETANGYHILVYEWFQCQSLRQMMDSETPFLERQVVSIATQAAAALQYAQIRGVRHGWLSPESILLSKFDEDVKLFGFASDWFFERAMAQNDGENLRHSYYLPPEQLLSPKTADPDDCYALGVTLYQLLLSKLPFESKNLTEMKRRKQEGVAAPHVINTKLSPNFSSLVTSFLDPHPQKRTTLGTFLNYLSPESDSNAMDDESPSSFSPAPRKRGFPLIPQKFVGSKRRIAYSVITAVIFLSFLASIMVFTQLSTSSTERMQLAYEEFIAEERGERLQQNGESPPASSPVLSPDTSLQETTDIDEAPQTTEPDTPTSTAVETVEETPAPIQPEPAQEEAQPAAPVQTTLRIVALAEGQPTTAEVRLNGDAVGTLSSEGRLDVPDLNIGPRYTVQVLKSGFKPWERTIRLNSQPVHTIRANLQRDELVTTSITFTPVPFATHIQVGSQSQFVALPATLDLTFGTHLITFIDREFSFTWRTQITIDENSPEEITINSERVGTGELLVVLENPIEYGYAFVSVDGQPEHTTPYKFQLSAGKHRVRIFREGYVLSPSDTTIFVRPSEEMVLRCTVE